MKRSKNGVLKEILNFIFNLNEKKNKNSNIRKVYFGIRIRFLLLLTGVMFFILLTIGLIMYLNQLNLLKEEKFIKAEELIGILSGNAEFYLDNSINEELNIKFDAIKREAYNFKKNNNDIFKIILVNKDYWIKFSTDKNHYGKKLNYSYFEKCLKEKEEKASFQYLKKEPYLAVTYPIFIHSGETVNILNDFKTYYPNYDNLTQTKKRKVYYYLWEKYKDSLKEDFDPKKNQIPEGQKDKIIKAWDIDFLFVNLFFNIMKAKKERIKNTDYWLFQDKWLFIEKEKKIIANKNNNSTKVKAIDDLIKKRINYLNSQVDEIRRLGALAILFDVKKIRTDTNRNIETVVIVTFIIFILSIIIFLFVINYMIKNLKKFEKWALSVADGNIDNKIKIETNDEIGRLSDIFNNMLDELKIKFHLEKFVSKSTKKMIDKKIDKKSTVDLGRTGKKSLAFIFSDVRGFTSFSEKNNPEIVIEVLNLYFDLQARIIKSNKGDIDDYVGDQIMAHFGGEKRADTAIKVAIEISREVEILNSKRKKEGLPYFEIGIGIHGGDVIVGNIGTGFRMDFTCLGDAVNLTSRLCSSAGPGEIIASQELFSQTTGKYKFRKLSSISVKGKAKKIKVIKIIP